MLCVMLEEAGCQSALGALVSGFIRPFLDTVEGHTDNAGVTEQASGRGGNTRHALLFPQTLKSVFITAASADGTTTGYQLRTHEPRQALWPNSLCFRGAVRASESPRHAPLPRSDTHIHPSDLRHSVTSWKEDKTKTPIFHFCKYLKFSDDDETKNWRGDHGRIKYSTPI